MLGGWKTQFDLSFDLSLEGPTRRLVTNNKGEYILSLPIGHSLAKVHANIENLEIILPSGSRDIQVNIGREIVNNIRISYQKGWLVPPFAPGKTIVSIPVGPLYPSQTTDEIKIKYTLSPMRIYESPVLLSLYVFVIFAVYIFSRRVRMEISTPAESMSLDTQNGDYDICKKIENSFTELCRANTVLIELIAGESDKAILESAKETYRASHGRIVDEIESLCEQFIGEKNRVDRTVRIVLNLKNQRDHALSLIDAAIAGKDVMNSAGVRLIEAENEMASLVGRVLEGSITPPPSPRGSSSSSGGTIKSPSGGTSSGSRDVRKRGAVKK
jgi:hypothetical protein